MHSFFFIVVTIVLGINLSWYALSDGWVRHDLVNYPRARAWVRRALIIWMLVIFLPLIGMLIPGLGNPLEYGPWLWLAAFYLWMGAIFFWMLGMALVGIPVWSGSKLLKWWQNRRGKEVNKANKAKNVKEAKAEAPSEAISTTNTRKQGPTLTRRQLIRLGLVATPPLLVTGASGVAWWGKQQLNIYTQELPVVGLAPDLEGLTITHLSDIHIGMLTGRERVEGIIEQANNLKSDLTVVTGDILDQDIGFLPDLLDTIGALKAPMGVYLCIGNHDKIQDANQWVTNVRKAGLNLLLDEAAMVDTGKTPLKLLGIDFSRDERYDLVNIRKADQSLSAPANALKILLAHNPHAFDVATEAEIPITLAGHTHGGQIVLRLGKSFEIFNPGNYLFRYVDGIYRSNRGDTMFVHKGSGDWFPLRIGAPAEIVQLKLKGV
ncbi:MAG: metallophosphoesterase [Bacillota bacterium]|nr:metallophosphoesterase [Bacillota bacterium]